MIISKQSVTIAASSWTQLSGERRFQNSSVSWQRWVFDTVQLGSPSCYSCYSEFHAPQTACIFASGWMRDMNGFREVRAGWTCPTVHISDQFLRRRTLTCTYSSERRTWRGEFLLGEINTITVRWDKPMIVLHDSWCILQSLYIFGIFGSVNQNLGYWSDSISGFEDPKVGKTPDSTDALVMLRRRSACRLFWGLGHVFLECERQSLICKPDGKSSFLAPQIPWQLGSPAKTTQILTG